MTEDNMDEGKNNTLYKEILTMFFGGAVVTMIGWFFWLPEIVASDDALVYQMLLYTLFSHRVLYPH